MRVFISCCYCHENWKRQQNEQTEASQPYRLLNRGNILNVAKKKKKLQRNVLVWTCINLWIIMLNDKLYQISQRFYCYCGLKKWFLIGCCLTCEAALRKIKVLHSESFHPGVRRSVIGWNDSMVVFLQCLVKVLTEGGSIKDASKHYSYSVYYSYFAMLLIVNVI